MASAPASFKIGPLTTYASPAEMAAWIERADPGAAVIYATGPVLGDHEAARMARRWHDEGLAELFQRRADRPNAFEYCARKRSARTAASFVAGPVTLSNTERLMLAILTDAARAGAACPSNDALAAELRLKDKRAARYRFDRLVAAGHLRVIEPARFGPRVIEICASGLRTRSCPPSDAGRGASAPLGSAAGAARVGRPCGPDGPGSSLKTREGAKS